MSPPEKPVVAVEGGTKTVVLPTGEQLSLLDGVSFEVHPGEVVAVTGRSGSGKTTLLRALGLFTPFDAGHHELLGVDVRRASDLTCSRLRARRIGFVFQQFQLLSNLTATGNVEYAGLLAGMGRTARRSRSRQLLQTVGLGERLRSRPEQLSGGEQQRVAIVRALVKGPSLVLADEPTGALDRTTSETVLGVLLAMAREVGAATVVVTHDEAVAARCDRRLHLLDGRLTEWHGAGSAKAHE